jgi:hypothetical protein
MSAIALSVCGFVVFAGGGEVASGACPPTTILPCTDPTTAPTTAPTTVDPPTTEVASTTQVSVATTARSAPVETTAKPATAQQTVPVTESRQAAATTTPTSNPLIVPGPADGAAASGETIPGEPAAATKSKNEDKTGTVVGLVIAALLVVAILLGLLTYRFWRNTRPLVVHPEDDKAQPEKVVASTPKPAAASPATVESPLIRR